MPILVGALVVLIDFVFYSVVSYDAWLAIIFDYSSVSRFNDSLSAFVAISRYSMQSLIISIR